MDSLVESVRKALQPAEKVHFERWVQSTSGNVLSVVVTDRSLFWSSGGGRYPRMSRFELSDLRSVKLARCGISTPIMAVGSLLAAIGAWMIWLGVREEELGILIPSAGALLTAYSLLSSQRKAKQFAEILIAIQSRGVLRYRPGMWLGVSSDELLYAANDAATSLYLALKRLGIPVEDTYYTSSATGPTVLPEKKGPPPLDKTKIRLLAGSGRMGEAICLYRATNPVGMKEAKEAVERICSM